MSESYRIQFENGTEKVTGISFFAECALDDPEATVFDADGNEVTDLPGEVEVVA